MGDETDSHEDVGGALYIEDTRFPMAAMHNTSVRMTGIDSQSQQYEVDLRLERGNLVIFPAATPRGAALYSQARANLYRYEYRRAK